MKDAIELIKALAEVFGALGWPIAAVVIALLFKSQIRGLMNRKIHLKVLGQEVDLGESLEQLHKDAQQAASEEPPKQPEPEPPVEGATTVEVPEPVQEQPADKGEMDILREVLNEAVISPKAALILLAAEIEREVRKISATLGGPQRRRPLGLLENLADLQVRANLPRSIVPAVREFWDVRNRIIHGGKADPDDVLSAVDSGLTILRTLQAYPRAIYAVYHPGVEVFADPEGKQVREGVRGVIIATQKPDEAFSSLRVFPTTKVYRAGMRVSWEWSTEKQWGESWYRDPVTKEIQYAWRDAAEFVGRPIEEA